MAVEPSEKAAGIIRDFERVKRNRYNWESHWDEIARRILPSYSGAFVEHGMLRSKGEKRTEEIFDSTAAIALNRFAAILDSLLTPRNQTWHRLTASDPALNRDRRVKLWFEEVNRRLFKYRYSPKANFSAQNQQNYKSLGAFGSGCLFVDELANEPGLRYRNNHLGETYFLENHQGLVDKVFRHFPMTGRQAIQKWGEDRLPRNVVEKTKSNPQTEFFFLHVVAPRNDFDPLRVDAKGMKFESVYVSMEGQAVLSEGGFHTFPYAISRYEQAPGETYGRSPAMDVLPAIKTLNEEKKTVLKQGHRTVDPVLLAHDDGVLDSFSLKPGAINYGGVTADGRVLVHPLPVGNLAIGKELMDDERLVINDAFLVTLFQILVETPQMTATEVLERTREKGILLAPTVGRQESEYLGPLIEREVDLLARQQLIPPMPEPLREAKGEFSIEYDNPMSRAARAEEAAGLMRTVEAALNVVNVTQDPAPLDHFDWDVIIPEIAEIQAVPTRWMRSIDAVQKIRADRAAQAQAQELIQAAPGAAAMTKAVATAQRGGA